MPVPGGTHAVQFVYGGAMGWATGKLVSSAGKELAYAFGGITLLINMGYMNWEDLDKKGYVDKVLTLARKNTIAAAGFGAGFFLGLDK